MLFKQSSETSFENADELKSAVETMTVGIIETVLDKFPTILMKAVQAKALIKGLIEAEAKQAAIEKQKLQEAEAKAEAEAAAKAKAETARRQRRQRRRNRNK